MTCHLATCQTVLFLPLSPFVFSSTTSTKLRLATLRKSVESHGNIPKVNRSAIKYLEVVTKTLARTAASKDEATHQSKEYLTLAPLDLGSLTSLDAGSRRETVVSQSFGDTTLLRSRQAKSPKIYTDDTNRLLSNLPHRNRMTRTRMRNFGLARQPYPTSAFSEERNH